MSTSTARVAQRRHRRLRATISLVAGRGIAGGIGDGGPAILAQLDAPDGVAVDRAGRIVLGDATNRVRYIAFGDDHDGRRFRRAGFGGDGGLAIDAQLMLPIAVAADPSGGIVIADQLNHRVRRVNVDGTITTIAGGGFRDPFSGDGVPATEVTLNNPEGVAVDDAGNVFIVDTANEIVRRVDLTGTITTVAGVPQVRGFAGDGGPATEARLAHPTRVALGRNGEFVIADRDNHRIRRVGPHGKISTVAGNGLAAFGGDGGPAIDAWLTPRPKSGSTAPRAC